MISTNPQIIQSGMAGLMQRQSRKNQRSTAANEPAIFRRREDIMASMQVRRTVYTRQAHTPACAARDDWDAPPRVSARELVSTHEGNSRVCSAVPSSIGTCAQ